MVITELVAGTPSAVTKNGASSWSFHSTIEPTLVHVSSNRGDYQQILLKEREVVHQRITLLCVTLRLIACKGHDPQELKEDPGLTEATVYRRLAGLGRGSARSGHWPILLRMVEHGEAHDIAAAADLVVQRSDQISNDLARIDAQRLIWISDLDKHVTLRNHKAVDQLWDHLGRELVDAQRKLGSL